MRDRLQHLHGLFQKFRRQTVYLRNAATGTSTAADIEQRLPLALVLGRLLSCLEAFHAMLHEAADKTQWPGQPP